MKRKVEKNRGKWREKRRGEAGEKEKKKEREKSTDIGSVGGSHKQLKNIEWWQMSDGAKRGVVFWVMGDEWWKLSEEWWVIKKINPNKASVSITSK